MSKIIILFPPGYTVNNEHFNDVKAGDVFSLTPKLVEADDDEYFDEDTFIRSGTYEMYLKKRTTSCILLEMVKDGKGVRHTGMSKEDTEEARKKKLADERKKAKERKLAKKQAVPDTPRSSA
jgi:phage protein D